MGQLNFFDFLARVDLELDRADGSNGNLVPPQSWVHELESSFRLGAFGNANLRTFHEDIADIVDQIPLPGGGQAVGNISFGMASAFIENKNVAGMTVRGSISNLLDRRNFFDRTVFADRLAGAVSISKSRVRRFGTIFTLEIEGSF